MSVSRWCGVVLVMLVAGAATAEAQSKSRRRGSYKKPTAEEALAFLKTLPPVGRKVDGKPQMVQEWADKSVEDVKTMKTLQFGGHVKGGKHLHLKGDDWKYLTAFESVEIANLWEIDGADDRAFYHLGHLSPTVTRLFVEQATVTDAGVKHLQNLKNLKFVGIGWTQTITDRALVQLAGIPSLEEINVSGCPGIQGPGLRYLVKLKNLKKLHLNQPGFGDKGLAFLAPLRVEEIHLNKPPAWAKKPYTLTPNGLKELLSNRRALPKLKVIHLKNAVSAKQAADLQKLRPGLTVKR